ncbi:hypothetical protein ABDK00_014115 [Niabella insulamsoli]|uniref:hypothetical protein n=1 Tax=Niabella insulamsoli TaxID=3144874 RepID=UPI0031FC6B71
MNEELLNLLERASGLVGNPGVNISSSTDIACDKWQEDYEAYIAKIKQQTEKMNNCFTGNDISGHLVDWFDKGGVISEAKPLLDYLNARAAAYARAYAIKVLEKAAENAKTRKLGKGLPVIRIVDKDSITDEKNLEV